LGEAGDQSECSDCGLKNVHGSRLAGAPDAGGGALETDGTPGRAGDSR